MSKGIQSASLLIAAVLHLVRALHRRKKGMKREVRLQVENQISMLIHQIAEIYMAVRRNEILYKSVKDESVVDHTFTNSSSEGHSVAHDISETIKLIKIWEFNDISIATQLEEKLHYLKQYY